MSAPAAYTYQLGWNNHHCTEALPGALPVGMNSPQKPPLGLYAEQLSGTAFTVARAHNERSWLYRIRPTVGHAPFKAHATLKEMGAGCTHATVEQIRWKPFALPPANQHVDFVAGLHAVAGAGDPSTKSGVCIYNYACNTSMKDAAFCNSDGDFLIVPQLGTLDVISELGRLHVEPCEVVVMPRGVRFAINVTGPSRGYVLEIFDGHFTVPDLGPIGSNGLANPRDFKYPVAWFEDRDCTFTLVSKFCNQLQTAEYDHSVFDVVAWHGNYAPFKYDLRLFNTMNSVSYDHPDPSIYTVLTCQSNSPGTAVADFVCFPPRWMAMENTFRPPWFHRNCMTEFMGLIEGQYDAKEGEGFSPGGASLHSAMVPHGPDVEAWKKATAADTSVPGKIPAGSMAFMFESCYIVKLTEHGLKAPRDQAYTDCWKGFPNLFRAQQHDKK